MPEWPREILKPKLLLGEGSEEVFVFEALIATLGVTDVQVDQYRGTSRLPDYLDAIKRQERFRTLVSLGVTRDADSSADAAFASIRSSLAATGLAEPSAPGMVVPGRPAVGILILPSGSQQGMLEDVCLAAIENHAAMPCVSEYFSCLAVNATAPQSDPSKARLRVWLAAQTRPDLRLGEAAEAGYLPWEHSAFSPLKAFVRAL